MPELTLYSFHVMRGPIGKISPEPWLLRVQGARDKQRLSTSRLPPHIQSLILAHHSRSVITDPEQVVEPGQSFQENVGPFVGIFVASCDEEENGLVEVEV